MKTIFMGGAHRGGTAISETALGLLDSPREYGRVVIADPKEDRASDLARYWRSRGVPADGFREPCEKAVDVADADAIVLAIDTITPMADVLERSDKPTQWQLMARGLGEDTPVIGLSGTVTDGDTEIRASSVKLIRELGSFIKPQSSGAIRENPLNADGLHTMRNTVSRHSVGRLRLLDREPRDITGGTLNLFCGTSSYPMVIQQKPLGQKWRELKEQVLEAEMPTFLGNTPAYAVASVGRRNVDFFVVDTVRGRRMVRSHMPLVHTLPTAVPEKSNVPLWAAGALGAAAIGIGLLAFAPAMLGAAVVTD